MKIKDVNNVCIIDIERISVSKSDLIELKRFFVKKAAKKRIGINLKNIAYINHDFLEFLKDCSSIQRVSLFNLNNDILLLLFVSKFDKFAEMYLDERDFVDDKRRMVYRRLKLLKSA